MPHDDTAADRYFALIARGETAGLRRLVSDHPEVLAARAAPSGGTGLHAAVGAEQPAVARVLLDAGIDIDAHNAEGRTALHDSIEYGQIEITELLLERGAGVDVCAAAILGRLELVRELLDGDADLANDRSTGLSPLGWASFGNQVDAATLLLDRGARLDDGELLCAASVGHVEVGRLLIARGADPNAVDAGAGGTALHAAAAMRYSQDSRPFVAMLLRRGADPRVLSTAGATAAEIADERAACPGERRPFREIAALLRDAGG